MTDIPVKFRCLAVNYQNQMNALLCPVLISKAFDPRATTDCPPYTQFTAIWDTGATGSVITQRIVSYLDLKPIGMTKVHHYGGEDTRPVYLVNLVLPNKVGVSQLRVTLGEIIGADFLIGMDIISRGDFAVTNANGKTLLVFRMPSRGLANLQPPERPPAVPQISRKISPNEPCPCNSGKKYKKCCAIKPA